MSYPVWSANIDSVAAAVRSVAQRYGDLPVDMVVLSRLIVGLGRDLVANQDEILRPHGLSESEFRVLVLLYGREEGSANAGDLVGGAAQSPANITRIANTLVARSFITREPGVTDRRCVTLRITRRGEAMVKTLLPKLSLRTRQAFGPLGSAELRRLHGDLRRVADALAGMASDEMSTREGAR